MCHVKKALTIKKQYRTGVPVERLAAACYMVTSCICSPITVISALKTPFNTGFLAQKSRATCHKNCSECLHRKANLKDYC